MSKSGVTALASSFTAWQNYLVIAALLLAAWALR